MRRFWTDDEIAVLREEYPHKRTDVIAKKLGRKLGSVYQKAASLGLVKTDEYLASPDACRLRRGEHVGKATQFGKGHRPWNAGTKGVHKPGGRAKETQFKPGHRPHTWKPVGSERVTRDGILERKMTDTGYPPRDWVPVHVLLWREHHGEVPKGHLVVFKNGDRTDIRIENLECITRAENMRRNSYHTRYPKEIAQVIQLRGALNRQINKRKSA